jgi:hypothetical protein
VLAKQMPPQPRVTFLIDIYALHCSTLVTFFFSVSVAEAWSVDPLSVPQWNFLQSC